MTLIEANDLEFSYEPLRPTILRTTLSLQAGTMTALIGANGCGKSTLIRLLAGIIRPSRGSVSYRQVDFHQQDRRQLARRLAYVPQSTSRAFPFTALEIVLTGRTPHSAPFRLENTHDTHIAHQALKRVGVPHLANRRITELSGGERQLVAVARALAQESECILLDEPAASLDLKHRAGLIRLLYELRNESQVATLMITHDLSLLEPVFDRVIAMRDGRILQEGTPQQVLSQNTLAAIYDDPYIRVRSLDDRLHIWSEVFI